LKLPFDPCGQICGFLHSFFKTRIRPYADSDETVEIRWYRAAPDAKVIPFYHRFSMDIWDDHRAGYEGPGQVGPFRKWDKGINVNGWPGLCHKGTIAQWQGHCLSTDPVGPTPDCCRPTVHPVCGCGTPGPTPVVFTPNLWVKLHPCGCGTPIAYVQFTPLAAVSTACLCATPTTGVGHVLPDFGKTCLCAKPETFSLVAGYTVNEACLCAKPQTAALIPGYTVNEACLCAQTATAQVVAGYTGSRACLCAQTATSSQIAGYTVNEACLCAQTATGVQLAGYTVNAACLCGQPATRVLTVADHPFGSSISAGAIPSTGVAVSSSVTVADSVSGGGIPSTAVQKITGGVTTPPCAHCPGASAAQWKIVVSGFTGAWASLNGTWILNYAYSCDWRDTPGFYTWQFAWGAAGWYIKGANNNLSISTTYGLLPSVNCLGANTMNWYSSTPIGPNPGPSSVTVTPV